MHKHRKRRGLHAKTPLLPTAFNLRQLYFYCKSDTDLFRYTREPPNGGYKFH